MLEIAGIIDRIFSSPASAGATVDFVATPWLSFVYPIDLSVG